MKNSYVSSERKFCDWYIANHQMCANNKAHMIVRQLGAVVEHDEMLSFFEHAMLQLKALSSCQGALGVIYVDYGYSYAAIEGRNGLAFITHQSTYEEIEHWKYDVSEQLGYEEDDENEVDSLDAFAQWIDDPKDRMELFHDVYRKILKHIVTETLDRLGESNEKALLIMLPALPKCVAANWDKLIKAITKEKCIVIIDNHSAGLPLKQGISTFMFHSYTIETYETTLVEVYTQESNGQIYAESFFYDAGYESEPRELSSVERILFNTDACVLKPSAVKKEAEKHHYLPMLPIRLGNVPGFTAFLRTHPATFREFLFTPLPNTQNPSVRMREIKSLFSDNESLSTAYVCAQLCHENELSNISLMDMATICSLLENNRYFQKTNIITHRKRVLFGYIDELPLDIDLMSQIPSNHATIGWRCFADQKAIPDYHTMSSSNIEAGNIVPVLQSIVSHYDYCTTEDIASDLYYMWKGGQEEPSAMLTAKVYLLLAGDSSFKTVRSSEIVQKPIVETEIIRKEIPKPVPVRQQDEHRRMSTVRTEANKKRDSLYEISLSDMGFSSRTYNSLMRANLLNAGLICAKTDAELLKVRNLGMHGIEEIQKWKNRNNLGAPQKESMASVPKQQLGPKTPATLDHLPKKVISKQYGEGTLIELISSQSGTKITIQFGHGIKKTFLEKPALQSGSISYEY